jgi:hypothetical protein
MFPSGSPYLTEWHRLANERRKSLSGGSRDLLRSFVARPRSTERSADPRPHVRHVERRHVLGKNWSATSPPCSNRSLESPEARQLHALPAGEKEVYAKLKGTSAVWPARGKPTNSLFHSDHFTLEGVLRVGPAHSARTAIPPICCGHIDRGIREHSQCPAARPR